jgi:hypothetical protein
MILPGMQGPVKACYLGLEVLLALENETTVNQRQTTVKMVSMARRWWSAK